MKVTLLITALLFFTLVPDLAISQGAVPDISYSLVAKRGGTRRFYNAGVQLVLKHRNGNKLLTTRGYFAGERGGEVVIKRRKRSLSQTLIDLDSIVVLRKIRPTRRLVYAIVGTALITGGVAGLEKGTNTPGRGMTGPLFIPLVAAGVFFTYAVPVSLISEIFNAKKQSRGWRFDLQHEH